LPPNDHSRLVRRLAGPGALLALALVALGLWLDRSRPLPHLPLWAGLQVASLAGAGLGLAAAWPRAGRPRRALFAVAVLLGWRLVYFPVMVFSGHVASIGEWLLATAGAPIAIYPAFLVCVAALHALAAVAVTLLVAPPHPLLAAAVAPIFVMALCVSFNKPSDLRALPDPFWRLDAPVPARVEARANPYLPYLFGPGYLPNQRVVLLAAGLTYETIPGSPWAYTVMAVLEELFNRKPHASTADRVLDHYLAYQSAHDRIGCRRLADCPAAP
jgi:hypothetical protein